MSECVTYVGSINKTGSYRNVYRLVRNMLRTWRSCEQDVSMRVALYKEELEKAVINTTNADANTVLANMENEISDKIRLYRERLDDEIVTNMIAEAGDFSCVTPYVFEKTLGPAEPTNCRCIDEFIKLRELMLALGTKAYKNVYYDNSCDLVVDHNLFHPKRIISAAAEYYSVPVAQIGAHNLKGDENERSRLVSFICVVTGAHISTIRKYCANDYCDDFDFRKDYSFTKVDAWTDAKEIVMLCSKMKKGKKEIEEEDYRKCSEYTT